MRRADHRFPRDDTRTRLDDQLVRMTDAILRGRKTPWDPYESEDEWRAAEVEQPSDDWVARGW